MRCFVTGASGFVGSALASKLHADGHEVIAMAHDDAPADSLPTASRLLFGLPEEIEEEFAVELAGIDVLFHCDSFFDIRGTEDVFRQANVLGTRKILDAAILAGIKRIVFLSSQVAGWNGQTLLPCPDGMPVYPERFGDPYSASRAEAEKLVIAAARAGRIEATALRPGWTWGPGDRVLLPLLVKRAQQGAIAMVGDGELVTATTYVEHLVQSIITAAHASACVGRVYYVSDENRFTQREFIDMQLGSVGIMPRYRYVPPMVAKALAAVVDRAGPLVGGPITLMRLITGLASTEIIHDSSDARRDLHYESSVSPDDGLAKLRTWATRIGGADALADYAGEVFEIQDGEP